MNDDPITGRVALLGATGFVGSAVQVSLEEKGWVVDPVRAPRLRPRMASDVDRRLDGDDQALVALRQGLRGVDAVVNCAGNPDASSRDEAALIAVNAVLPGLVAQVAVELGLRRFVHVSSAVVQGRRAGLDETRTYECFSAYSRSKAAGESMALTHGGGRTVVYRPPSVHALDRRVTKLIARIARSPLSTVASPANSPSPQALIDNVASAVAFLTCTSDATPEVVIHPWEGLTTASLLKELGGREPRLIPRPLARVVSNGLMLGGRFFLSLSANARRVDMIWFGQPQAESWLTGSGWIPPAGLDQWQAIGQELARRDTGRRLR